MCKHKERSDKSSAIDKESKQENNKECETLSNIKQNKKVFKLINTSK